MGLKNYLSKIKLEQNLFSRGFYRFTGDLKRAGGKIRRSPGKTVAAVATGVWESVWGAWNYAYQTVISDPYNAARLKMGEIAQDSRLYLWPYNEVKSNSHNMNVPRALEPSERIAHYFFGNPVIRVVIMGLPLVLWGGYALKKRSDANWAGRRNSAAEDFVRQYGDQLSSKSGAFADACVLLDANRGKIHSPEDARNLLKEAYERGQLTGEYRK